MHARAGFEDGFGLSEADATPAAGDEDDFVLEGEEFGEAFGAVELEGLGGRKRMGGGLMEGAGVVERGGNGLGDGSGLVLEKCSGESWGKAGH